MARILTGCKI